MAQPGWYPDPAGTPATYRYWDGGQWSAVTTSDPSSPPPDGGTPASPPHPPAAGQGNAPPNPTGGYAGGVPPMPPTSGGPSGGGSGRIVVIALAALLVLVLLGVAAFFGIAALTSTEAKSSDDVPATSPADGGDELVPPSEEGETDAAPPPLTAPPGPAECRRGAPTLFDDQSGSDRVASHGLSLPRVEGYQVDPLQSFAFTWAFDFVPQVLSVEQGWASVYGVGGVETAFGTPEETAEAVVECMTESPLLYSGFQDRRDRSSEEIDVPGAESAWRITTEIHVDNPAITVDGDLAQVIVVDTGDKALYGLYISVVPLDDEERITQQEEVADRLRAE